MDTPYKIIDPLTLTGCPLSHLSPRTPQAAPKVPNLIRVIKGWYDNDAFVELNPSADLPGAVKMIGIREYNLQTNPRSAMSLKLATGDAPMYVGFNSAAGTNIQNDEADNEVTIATKGKDYYEVLFLRAHLV